MRVSAALEPEPVRTALHPDVSAAWVGDGYSCARVAFESLPGLLVTGNVYRPASASAGAAPPGILCPHGHWQDGRLQADDRDVSVVARCVQLASMGAVVFSYDMVGYNDSCQLPHRTFIGDAASGLSLLGLQTWNTIRSLDYLLEHEGVDPRRVGITGASGGATQALIACAVDERFAAAAPVNMISLHMQGGCRCENAPLLRLHASNVDIAGLHAPRPLFVGSSSGDWTRDTPQQELPALREVYRLCEAAEPVGHHVDAAHGYNREMRQEVYRFFGRHLLGLAEARVVKQAVEQPIPAPPLRESLVWWGREAPPPLSAARLREVWQSHCEASLRRHLRDRETARASIVPLLSHVVGLPPGESPNGGDSPSAAASPSTLHLSRQGGRLVVTEAAPASYPDGATVDGSEPVFATYNLTPGQRRVQDILAALATGPAGVTLEGRGSAGAAALVAGALSPQVATVDVELDGFDPRHDGDWQRYFDLPTLQRIGGLAPVLAQLDGRSLRLRGASPGVARLQRTFAR